MSNHDHVLLQLSAMGFDERQVQVAISHSHGDFERALEYLLLTTGSNDDDDNNDDNTTLVRCDISQYSVEHGQSACTCMALIGAVLFLKQQQQQQCEDDSPPTVLITPEFLTSMIYQGLDVYNKLVHDNAQVNEQHMSAEQVLSKNVEELNGLVLQGDIRQGIVGHSQFGFQHFLQTYVGECLDNGIMAVVITKTPETVVVCLCPPSSYILLDSHPRPPSMDSAHAYMFTSLDTLVRKLEEIFPYADLGSGVSEVMAMMYNSFDMYPLVWKEQGTKE